MRWESLFDDLEAQVEAQDRLAHDCEVADLARAERAAVTLADRLRAHRGAWLGLQFVDGLVLRAVVNDVGADCLVVREAERASRLLVPLHALVLVEGLGQAADPGVDTSERRLGLAAALRRVTRDRAAVRLELRGGTALTGTPDRVGADQVDLAIHPQDVARHERTVSRVTTVPLVAILRVVLL